MTDQSSYPKSGASDPWAQITPDTLVMSTADYIVYIGSKKDLQWETTLEYDEKSRADTKFDLTKHYSIFGDAGDLEARARKDFGDDTRTELLCLIGNVIVCILELDYAGAEKALAGARQFLRERSEEISRFWYLSASFAMAFIFIVIGLLIWICRAWFESILGASVVWLILAGTAGATGALLSVILRSGKLNFDPSAGRLLHYLEGASRIWAGALSGVVASLAIKAGIILGTLAATQTNTVMILAAVAAGASERLATSIISKIDSENEKTPDSDSKRKST